ncbi:hypothetical protein ACVW0P_001404 [Mucilaginibacter sp. UYNi724]
MKVHYANLVDSIVLCLKKFYAIYIISIILHLMKAGYFLHIKSIVTYEL